jgi:secondary thiamine-phosphate synthase enzyme
MSPTEMTTIDIRSSTREELIDVTALVRAALKRIGVSRGMAFIYCPHTTAGVTIQENTDPTVRSDMLGQLRKLVPRDPAFEHSEDNADAHIKSSLMGVTTSVPVDGGKMQLGQWQAIYFCEFDGPRDRRLHIKVIEG